MREESQLIEGSQYAFIEILRCAQDDGLTSFTHIGVSVY